MHGSCHSQGKVLLLLPKQEKGVLKRRACTTRCRSRSPSSPLARRRSILKRVRSGMPKETKGRETSKRSQQGLPRTRRVGPKEGGKFRLKLRNNGQRKNWKEEERQEKKLTGSKRGHFAQKKEIGHNEGRGGRDVHRLSRSGKAEGGSNPEEKRGKFRGE